MYSSRGGRFKIVRRVLYLCLCGFQHMVFYYLNVDQMAPKPKSSPTKNTGIAKDAKSQQKSLMLPPPDPPAPYTILEPEVNALSTCLIVSIQPAIPIV